MKTADSSVWRGSWGRLGLTAVIAGAIAWLIWHYGDRIGLDTTGLKCLGFVAAMIIVLFIRHGGIIRQAMQERWHRYQAERTNENPTDEFRIAQTPSRNVTVAEIRGAMRNLYGRGWPRKVRILLITGTPGEVEQLTPGLTSQYWQEDQGTLLLWGGDLDSHVDSQWLTALRKLRRRPADGMVWVTSLFDRLSSPDLTQPQPVPSDSMMDTLSHAISARNEALGWTLPLYVWSLHLRAGKPEERKVQALGCLLPAGCPDQGPAVRPRSVSPACATSHVAKPSEKIIWQVIFPALCRRMPALME